MYRMYASDPSARLNLGIRRRLAPLLNNDRKKIELMNILLFSLPGTPVIYYGDEIGMGDNFYLGDRNGVRTPMQWSSERNAGFSQANPQKLFLPPIIDPEYHYEAINVETQEPNNDSLLWWMKRLIALRKRYQAFGRGGLEFLQPQNRKVLAFIRSYKEERILFVANLSRLPQQTSIDLPGFNAWRPVDLFGRVEFSPVRDDGYNFTLTPYSFYWFSLEKPRLEALNISSGPLEEKKEIPVVTLADENLAKKINWPNLGTVLQEYVRNRGWFRSKARHIQSCMIKDVVPLHFLKSTAYTLIIQFDFIEGEPETYALPVMVKPKEHINEIASQYPGSIITHLQMPKEENVSVLFDAMIDKTFDEFLLQSISRQRTFEGIVGKISAVTARAFNNGGNATEGYLDVHPIKTEQTNTSVVYGDKAILKLFRSIEDGENPELEIGRFLTEKTSFTNSPRLLGALEYRKSKKSVRSMAVLQSYVPNEGDAWQYTLDSLERYFQLIVVHPTVQSPPIPRKHLLSLLREPPSLAQETIGTYLNSAQLLGERTAELHLALSSVTDDPNFAPEPFSFSDQISLYQSMRSLTLRVLQMLEKPPASLPSGINEDMQRVLKFKDTHD